MTAVDARPALLLRWLEHQGPGRLVVPGLQERRGWAASIHRGIRWEPRPVADHEYEAVLVTMRIPYLYEHREPEPPRAVTNRWCFYPWTGKLSVVHDLEGIRKYLTGFGYDGILRLDDGYMWPFGSDQVQVTDPGPRPGDKPAAGVKCGRGDGRRAVVYVRTGGYLVGEQEWPWPVCGPCHKLWVATHGTWRQPAVQVREPKTDTEVLIAGSHNGKTVRGHVAGWTTAVPGLAVTRRIDGWKGGKPTFDDEQEARYHVTHAASGLTIDTGDGYLAVVRARAAAKRCADLANWTLPADLLQEKAKVDATWPERLRVALAEPEGRRGA